MKKSTGTRLIWEEILKDPFVYRIREVKSRENAYLIVSGEDALAVDPHSADMLQNILMLCRGLGAEEGKTKLFLTAGTADDRLETLLKLLPAEMTVYIPLTAYDGINKEKNAVTGELKDTDAPEPARRVHVSDGTAIRLGRSLLRCIQTEGCRRGLMSLWMEKKGILFCGDAVGCDYLPTVRIWDSRIDTMGLQIETLRRLRSMPVQMILPGHGEPAGLEEPPGADSETAPANAQSSSNLPAKGRGSCGQGISAACAAVLDDAVTQYCIRILEVYQRVPSRGSIPAELMERQREDGDDVCSVLSCCKYLLYRRYIRCRETDQGEAVYERGSMLLTDWCMQQT